MATRRGLEPLTSQRDRLSVLTNCTTGPCYIYGGNNRARTCDPLLVRQVLSQLSYAPKTHQPQKIVYPTKRVSVNKFI